MASHHHLHHHTAAASHCYCYSPYSQCHHPPPPPPDCHPLYHPPPLYPPQTPLPNSLQTHPHPHLQERYFEEKIETENTIASLLRRIASLESALRGRSSSSSSPPYSLRAAAARTIQTHFRAFLLRRSRTLRQLKELASIKSALGFLKSPVTKKTHFDYDVVYHRAMTLVLKLDAIQGCDPMIRDGKSSVRRDLNKFLDFIDEFHVGRRGLSSGVNTRYGSSSAKARVPKVERKMGGNVKCGGLKSVGMQKLRSLVERIDKLSQELDGEEEENESIESPHDFIKNHNKNGALVKKNLVVQSKAKKSVSFADSDGKVYRVLRSSEPNLDDDQDEDDADDDDDDVNVDRVSRGFEDDGRGEVEEIGVGSKEAEDDDEVEEEAYSENGSDAEKDSRTYMRSGGDNSEFSPPLPLKMEARAGLNDKRKKLADNY